jgi:hypothetical protein
MRLAMKLSTTDGPGFARITQETDTNFTNARELGTTAGYGARKR